MLMHPLIQAERSAGVNGAQHFSVVCRYRNHKVRQYQAAEIGSGLGRVHPSDRGAAIPPRTGLREFAIYDLGLSFSRVASLPTSA
jgi:hypothetical protein